MRPFATVLGLVTPGEILTNPSELWGILANPGIYICMASVAVVPAVAAVAIGLAVDCVVAIVAMSAVARGALLTEGGGSKRPHSFPKQFRLRNHSCTI